MDQSDDDQSHRRHYRSRPLRTDGEEKLWDARDVADFLNTSTSWVYKSAAEGNLPTVKVPGLTRVRFQPSMIRKVARGEWRPSQVLPLKAG